MMNKDLRNMVEKASAKCTNKFGLNCYCCSHQAIPADAVRHIEILLYKLQDFEGPFN